MVHGSNLILINDKVAIQGRAIPCTFTPNLGGHWITLGWSPSLSLTYFIGLFIERIKLGQKNHLHHLEQLGGKAR